MPAKIPTHRPASSAHAAKAYERSAQRTEDRAFYNGKRWRGLRSAYLSQHPLCAPCEKVGRIEPATQVHHVEERKDKPDLAYEWDNLESVCLPCHNAKRARR